MGAVHGVYLKYVGLSAASYVGLHLVLGAGGVDGLGVLDSFSALLGGSFFAGGGGDAHRILSTSWMGGDGGGFNDSMQLSHIGVYLRLGIAAIFAYSTFVNGVIAVLFKLERGMSLVGKDRTRGTIPKWSYVAYFPFHLPSMLYTYVHTRKSSMKVISKKKNDDDEGEKSGGAGTHKEKVPVASEVQPGWWVGGCYSHELDKNWAAVVDLTVEFPESCIDQTKAYLCLPTWDGVPCNPSQLDQAAAFCAEAQADADRRLASGELNVPRNILVHCAHGRGRSTTVMCAALVKAGLYSTWEEAFENGIRPGRPVCKLNKLMRTALAEWQRIHVDGKKRA